MQHRSDCAVNNGPALEPGPCDCGGYVYSGNEHLVDFQPQPENCIMFHNNAAGKGPSLLFTIHPDGRIEKGPGFTTMDDASLRFWEGLGAAFPGWLDTVIAHRDERDERQGLNLPINEAGRD